jgi:hypothetical protein
MEPRERSTDMKDMKKVMLGAFLATLVAVVPAWAQGVRPVLVNVGGGVTIPNNDGLKDHFETGGHFNIGVLFAPEKVPFGMQVEYGYNGLSGKDRTIPLYATPVIGGTVGGALIESHHAMHFIDFNGVVKTPGNTKVGAYGLVGGGFYYRSVSLTTPDVGYTTYCDPYWYVCYPAVVSIDQVIGDRSSWDPGIDFGGGVTFKLSTSTSFYVETRWHYMWGPSFTDGQGIEQKANGSYFPITFGFRF